MNLIKEFAYASMQAFPAAKLITGYAQPCLLAAHRRSRATRETQKGELAPLYTSLVFGTIREFNRFPKLKARDYAILDFGLLQNPLNFKRAKFARRPRPTITRASNFSPTKQGGNNA
jgi:hypothetical protein